MFYYINHYSGVKICHRHVGAGGNFKKQVKRFWSRELCLKQRHRAELWQLQTVSTGRRGACKSSAWPPPHHRDETSWQHKPSLDREVMNGWTDACSSLILWRRTSPMVVSVWRGLPGLHMWQSADVGWWNKLSWCFILEGNSPAETLQHRGNNPNPNSHEHQCWTSVNV